MAVGLIGWLYKFYLNKKENKKTKNKTNYKIENKKSFRSPNTFQHTTKHPERKHIKHKVH